MSDYLPNVFVLGVTGGIGSGKTAATNEFERLGIQVVDADIVSREIVEPGQPALAKIAAHFGDNILNDGQLDRAALREIVFSDAAQKQVLNEIMHPAIREGIVNQLSQATSQYVILSAPLLFENGLQKYTDRNCVIDVPEELQLSRASTRDDVSQQQIAAIMNAQLSRKERLAQADDVVDNSGSLDALKEQVRNLNDKYLILSTK